MGQSFRSSPALLEYIKPHYNLPLAPLTDISQPCEPTSCGLGTERMHTSSPLKKHS